MVTRSLVPGVDDDESLRESLPDLLRQFGFSARVFPSAEPFLPSEVVAQTNCPILDIAVPGVSGPEVQGELANRQHKVPIVFIAASGDRSIREELQAAVAVE